MFTTTDMIMEQESDLRGALFDFGWPLYVAQIICDYIIDKRGPDLLRQAIIRKILKTPKKKLLMCLATATDPDFCPGRYELWMQYTGDHLMRVNIRFISINPKNGSCEYIKRDSWTEPMYNIWNFMLGDNDSYCDHFSWVAPSVHQFTSIFTHVCVTMMKCLDRWKHMLTAQEAAYARADAITHRNDSICARILNPFHHKPCANEKSQSDRMCCKAARIIMSEPSYRRNQEISMYVTFRDTVDPRSSWCVKVRGYCITAIEYDDGDEKSKITLAPDLPNHVIGDVCIWPFICHDPEADQNAETSWDILDNMFLSFDSKMELDDIYATMRRALKETLRPLIMADIAMFRKCAPHKPADKHKRTPVEDI